MTDAALIEIGSGTIWKSDDGDYHGDITIAEFPYVLRAVVRTDAYDRKFFDITVMYQPKP